MADLAVKFADGGDQYTFPYVQTLRDTFGDAVNSTSRMVGVHGGFDAYGSEEAPSAVGQVNLTFILWATSRNDMQAKIDAVRALKYLGKQKLYFQPQGTANERWCYARVNNIGVSRRPADQTDLVQLVTVSFQASDPHWNETETTTSFTASGTFTDQTVTNNGNAVALAKFVLVPPGGYQAEYPRVRRLVGGNTIDEMAYAGTLLAADELILDGRAKSVTLDGADAYSLFDFYHPDWLRLLPGDNTIRVIFSNAGDRADVDIYHYHTYR